MSAEDQGSCFEFYADLHDRIERAERLRRRGVVLMYSPAFAIGAFIVGMVCVFAFGGRPPTSSAPFSASQTLLLTVPGVATLLTLAVSPVGMVMRAVGASRLRRLGKLLEGETDPPAWPELRAGEMLGSWRVLEVREGVVALRREPFPRSLQMITRAGVIGFFLAMPALVLFHMAAAGASPGSVAALGALLVKGWFTQSWLRVERFECRERGDPTGPVAVYTCTRPYFIPPEKLRKEIVSFLAISEPGRLLVRGPEGDGIFISGFAESSAGVWQARRLAAEIADRLGFTPAEPEADEAEDEDESESTAP